MTSQATSPYGERSPDYSFFASESATGNSTQKDHAHWSQCTAASQRAVPRAFDGRYVWIGLGLGFLLGADYLPYVGLWVPLFFAACIFGLAHALKEVAPSPVRRAISVGLGAIIGYGLQAFAAWGIFFILWLLG